jgi:uncharacterized protein
VKIFFSVFLLLMATASAQAASFDCVAPVFPDHSTSNEGVRRIEKQVRQWRACNAAHRAESMSAEVSRLNTEVEVNLARWIAATRANSHGQFNGQSALTQMESEKVEYGMWTRGSSPTPVVRSGPSTPQ